MFNKTTKKALVIAGLTITTIYVVGFAFLTTHEFQTWAYSPFLEGMVQVFMGAGAIAVITAIILVFQTIIHAEQEKRQKVFEKKLALYERSATKLYEVLADGVLDEKEIVDLKILRQKLILLSRSKTIGAFEEIFDICINNHKNLKSVREDLEEKIEEFIRIARGDLDVQSHLSEKEKQEETEKLATLTSKNFFSGIDEKLEYLRESFDDDQIAEYQEFFEFVNSFEETQKSPVKFSNTFITWSHPHAKSPGGKRRFLMLKNPAKKQFNLAGLGSISSRRNEFRDLCKIEENSEGLLIKKDPKQDFEIIIKKPLCEKSKEALGKIIRLYSEYMEAGKPFQKP